MVNKSIRRNYFFVALADRDFFKDREDEKSAGTGGEIGLFLRVLSLNDGAGFLIDVSVRRRRFSHLLRWIQRKLLYVYPIRIRSLVAKVGNVTGSSHGFIVPNDPLKPRGTTYCRWRVLHEKPPSTILDI